MTPFRLWILMDHQNQVGFGEGREGWGMSAESFPDQGPLGGDE